MAIGYLDVKKLLNKMLACCYTYGTSGTWQYKKYADGTLVCWGYSTIDVTTGTKDRKELSFPVAFVGTPSVQLTVIENAYNIQPILLVWESSGKIYALNKASVPSKHINFNCLAIGKWK